MKRYNKFETMYAHVKAHSLKRGYRTKLEFKRSVYIYFKNEVQRTFLVSLDSNPYVFNQNEIKTRFGGKESLKSLCRNYYFDQEALYLSSK